MADARFEEKRAPATYFDAHFKRDAVKILPGEYYVTARDMLIVTVLGSCVSVCLRDRLAGIGGMNHFMLPGNADTAFGPVSNSARYGCYAMDILINHLLKLGAERRRLEAKIFGGGRVLQGFTVNQVGDRNAEFVLNYLKTEHIPIIAQDLLGVYPRKIYFFPATGRVLVKKLRSQHNTTIIDRETEYHEKIATAKVSGDVEWFK
ncbi:MAG: chemoreceptor glutamine deamidase CheD [Spongiibacteraceae bacterium]